MCSSDLFPSHDKRGLQEVMSHGSNFRIFASPSWDKKTNPIECFPVTIGGAGGTTSGAGQTSGVGLPQDQSVGMGLRAQELGLQMANAASQIKLNESQAKKNEAEATKIAGIDTQVQQATMENLIAQTANEKVKKGLIYADTRFKDALEEVTRAKVDEVGWNIKNLMKSLEIADKNIEATELDNELKSRTMEASVS